MNYHKSFHLHTTFRGLFEHLDNISKYAIEFIFECDKRNMSFDKISTSLNEALYPDCDKLCSIYCNCLSKFELVEKLKDYKQMSKCFSKIIDTELLSPKIFNKIQKHKNSRMVNCTSKTDICNYSLAEIYYLFAILENAEDNQKKAKKYFDNAIEQDPEWAECYCANGERYAHLKYYKSAINNYKKALKLFKKQSDKKGCNSVEEKIKQLESECIK